MDYLQTQTGDIAGGGQQELDKEIDEAFGDFTIDVEDDVELVGNDDTIALPESDDSGNEVKNSKIENIQIQLLLLINFTKFLQT